ncbi:MAG: hypothetical protein Q4A84_08550 [Neisseria sp.]|uniref:hypothetical protein n=1 Tax=Neisseria sp. TaxID=192066 RepID=UPI0026DB9582|nr:hypothetical protein [Neisseria sp.]MDO4641729.1 hypothetical protein [Neisseria sp.]
MEELIKKLSSMPILEIFPKLITMVISIGIISGTAIIFYYLQSIQEIRLISNILTSPTFALAIIFSIFFILIFLSYASPYAFSFLWYHSRKVDGEKINHIRAFLDFIKYLSKNILSYLIIVPQILTIILLCLKNKYQTSWISDYCYFIILIIYILIPPSFLFWRWTYKEERKCFDDLLTIFLIVFLINIFYGLFPLFLASRELSEYRQWGIYALLQFVNFINICFSVYFFKYFEKMETQQRYLSLILIPLCLFMTILAISNISMPQLSLTIIGFVESSNDAQWYTINKSFFEKNDLPKQYLLNLRNDFTKRKDKDCKEYSCMKKISTQDNWFYGYMAWNLGEKKLFCPRRNLNPNQDFEELKNKGAKNICILISGDEIQPLAIDPERDKMFF